MNKDIEYILEMRERVAREVYMESFDYQVKKFIVGSMFLLFMMGFIYVYG